MVITEEQNLVYREPAPDGAPAPAGDRRVAAAHGADALVSADAGFSAIANIRHVTPDANGIRYLLDHDTGDQE